MVNVNEGLNPFQFAGTPVIQFGSGMLRKLVDVLPSGAQRILFVMGSFQRTNADAWEQVAAALSSKQIGYEIALIHHEPTVDWVDQVVERHRLGGIDAVVAIGGGSAMDAGKAVSAMLCTEPGDTVLHYLEGTPGYRAHSGRKVPFVAIPTTSGTGSEMTKNAVIAITDSFKRSIRHDRFIPDAAILDPLLTISCPASVKAASGFDALTQLIESYVSTKASPLTDALALSGIEAAARSLLPICTDASDDAALHEQMAYASMLSGITLAHAGLGLVHGLAGPLGGLFPVPHGVICATLIAEVTKRNLEQLQEQQADEAAGHGWAKYAKVGAILTGHSEQDVQGCCARLVAYLETLTEQLRIPRLGDYGVTADNLDAVLDASDNKMSPVTLDRTVMREILVARI
ncbi:iron-containing alcohol dehydrogenase [Paenibacillus cremeus]|uniref:Iron-containing alcohol dehydrogenase n=1 Tax=Paenibacillus cremeus TaxID=2163881 RepID=A0A559KFV4_9BACL|nr:iron-containing alcohol dehydrogenase [Paenibacillus cremeus]TVY11014.1 iron-containing alcohol dehydrogenase [Paenibacillus cremeus]